MVYQALVANDPAKIPGLFIPRSAGTPALVKQLVSYAPGALPAVRRHLLDTIMASGAEGPRFDLAHGQMAHFAPDYLDALFGGSAPSGSLREMRRLALVGRAANFDVNPSGTARVGLTGADFTALAGAVAEALRGNVYATAALAAMPGGRLLLAKALLSRSLQDSILRAADSSARLSGVTLRNIVASELGAEGAAHLERSGP